MTIKEIEALSGMSRANIRYYEAEGFLAPERRENGYRDYSGEDLETLKRVKLLRLLGVSLADIKAAKDGSLPLEELMTRRLSGIAQERTALSQSEAVCRELREAQVRYEDLDAQRYLDELSRRPGGTLALPQEEALSLGVPVKKLRVLAVGAAALITASVVSLCGQIGWVGLLVPHAARMLVGGDNRRLIPASFGLGAAFFLVIDTLARCATAAEIPVSILTAVVGAPLFIVLLRRTGGAGL